MPQDRPAQTNHGQRPRHPRRDRAMDEQCGGRRRPLHLMCKIEKKRPAGRFFIARVLLPWFYTGMQKAPAGRFKVLRTEFWRASARYLLASSLAGCIRRPRAHGRLTDRFQDRRFLNGYLLLAPPIVGDCARPSCLSRSLRTTETSIAENTILCRQIPPNRIWRHLLLHAGRHRASCRLRFRLRRRLLAGHQAALHAGDKAVGGSAGGGTRLARHLVPCA